MAPRKVRRSGRRAPSGDLERWHEWYTVSVPVGGSTWVARRNLQIQVDRAFKCIRVRYEAVGSGPTIMQVRGYGPINSSSAIAETGPLYCGISPRRGYLKIPSSWFAKDTSPDAVIVVVDVICPDKSQQYKVVA